MKTRNIRFFFLLSTILFGFLSSCKKDNEEIPALAKPQISALEIGSGNNKTVQAGSDLHLEGDILAEALIAKIEIEVHQEGGGQYKFTKAYTDGKYIGVKNATFHEHIDVPADAPAGAYHFHFTVTDKAGNTTTIESPLTIQGTDAKVAYKLIFTEVAGEAHGDHFHDLADKEKVEPIVISFDEKGTALAGGHAHLHPAGIYKIELKQFDASSKEIQGQYIINKATADYYKAFLTGGSFVLNPNSSTGSGAIFQTKETTYGDGSAVNGATETTGIITYFTAGKDNEGEKNVVFVLRKFNDATTKAKVTRADWNSSEYTAKFAGQDLIKLSFELHAEEGED
ncbi:hypothetical protein AAW12_11885 [Sphingobacterium sp. Ag1]|uniref:DUF4625 domain-containing protein n=1 Tax=Sphingobacterium sp. Ag1 TaxID=1643451 RepID=UPI0006279C68|nr:DUF4625 domain-containing protein [Sphingobacterium sp. Ag1]KKO91209.1 hypothetical protein AAW12_11885 [Sphingobacterium sp. Ag1]